MRIKGQKKQTEQKLTHGAMWFECQECGKRWRMWLEKGVEDKWFRRIYPEKHKPAPFKISCQCGGTAEHVEWDKDLVLKSYKPILPHMNHFRYSENDDCAVTVIINRV